MSTDTRINQMRALVDDTRCLAADIQEQRSSDSLARLGVYMNWALQALDHAEKELADG
jgi:hypothetical protein